MARREMGALECVGAESLDWEKCPLIPTIAQDSTSREVLMLAFSSKESLALTLQTAQAHYFSRSKNRIWRKGEESGHTQSVEKILVDCDKDSLIFVIKQCGVACHTGQRTCFYREIALGNAESARDSAKDSANSTIFTARDSAKTAQDSATDSTDSAQITQDSTADSTFDTLYATLQARKNADIAESYTASLYHKGENAIGKKIAEEAAEFAFAIKDGKESEIIYECADLLYHSLVALSWRNLPPKRVMRELERRFGISGIAEKRARKG